MRIRIANLLYRLAFKIDPRPPTLSFSTSRRIDRPPLGDMNTFTLSLEDVRLDHPGSRSCGCRTFGHLIVDGDLGFSEGDLIRLSDHPSKNPLRIAAVTHHAGQTIATVEWTTDWKAISDAASTALSGSIGGRVGLGFQRKAGPGGVSGL